jgi:hypothetical protein
MVSLDRQVVVINSRIINGTGKTRISVTRFAIFTNRRICPCASRLKQWRPPKTVAPVTTPSPGGHMKIRMAHGIIAARALNVATMRRKRRMGARILPMRRRRRMIEALERGRIGMLSRLKLRSLYYHVH